MPNNQKKSHAARQGLLPGEYRKKSLVEVVRPILSEDSVKTIHGHRPPVDHWIVETMRLDGEFTVKVEISGVETEMPHKVVMKIRDHVNQIMRAQRSDSSRRVNAQPDESTKGGDPTQSIGSIKTEGRGEDA